MAQLKKLFPRYLTIIGGMVVITGVYTLSGDLIYAVVGYGMGVGAVSAIGKIFQG